MRSSSPASRISASTATTSSSTRGGRTDATSQPVRRLRLLASPSATDLSAVLVAPCVADPGERSGARALVGPLVSGAARRAGSTTRPRFPVVAVELIEQERLRYTSIVVGCSPDQVHIGMSVELIWIDSTSRR